MFAAWLSARRVPGGAFGPHLGDVEGFVERLTIGTSDPSNVEKNATGVTF